jgi:hypothetical protein
MSVAVTPDGARIVTGSTDNTAKVWDATSFAELAVLKGHSNWVMSVAVTPDGARIVTGSWDNTAKVWDAATFAELAVLKGHTSEVTSLGTVTSVAVTPDGARIVTGSGDRTARVWEVFTVGQALVAEAQGIAPRCLTTEQRQRYHLTAAHPRWCDTMQKWPYDAVTIVNAAVNAAATAAREHIEANRHREAIAALEQMIGRTPATAARLAPILAQAHYGIAWNAFLDVALRGKPVETLKDVLGDVETAVTLALENDGILEGILYTRAHIRLTLGNTDEALADFDKVIALVLDDIGGWYGRGLAHERKGNRDDAIADYRKAVALKPSDNDWAKHAHAQARAGLERLGAAP